jgi:hypothetical protein
MARIPDMYMIDVVANEYRPDQPERDHDPDESYGIFNSILDGFEEMKKRGVKNTTIALFESNPKEPTPPGSFIDTWDLLTYFNERNVSNLEKHFIQLEKHYTRIDLDSEGYEPELYIYKRIRIVLPFGRNRYYGYLTKVFYATGMDIVENVKSMSRGGIASIDLGPMLKKLTAK